MAKGYKHGAGGGSGGVNFFVVAYATEEELLAATPKENTIGVVTTDTITSWIFSATEPTEPVEGMVWFSTSTTSHAAFNALKKNTLQVYPISAKQYVGGAWEKKTSKSYQGGEWVVLLTDLVLLDSSGFHSTFSRKGTSNQYCHVTVGTNTIYLEANNTGSSTVYAWGAFDKKYDLTNYSTLTFTLLYEMGNAGIAVGASPSTSHSDYVTKTLCTSSGTFTLDISELKGEYHIVATAYGNSTATKGTITHIELKG